ncbi:NAD-dependent epimerase/dehydratase family protein [Pseudomonas sp. S5(2021)]|nr:NAD-dependent epimerase/dehydratase family protein [Pseudomonas sp. S5(2021)]
MNNALIGYTGFVGSTITRQTDFSACYRSTNIESIRGKTFDTVVCAGAPAQKWLANQNPEEDRERIKNLANCILETKCERLILISTVDVFADPRGANEESPISKEGLSPYGLHRRLLEEVVTDNFRNHLIVRLPGLVGPGLRKNVIFDFLNDNNLAQVDSRGVFQFYPMVNLWADIQTALQAGLSLIHLTAEPISVATVARDGFGREFSNERPSPPANYDLQTLYAKLFGGGSSYQYSARESLLAIRAYAQSEPDRAKERRS